MKAIASKPWGFQTTKNETWDEATLKRKIMDFKKSRSAFLRVGPNKYFFFEHASVFGMLGDHFTVIETVKNGEAYAITITDGFKSKK